MNTRSKPYIAQPRPRSPSPAETPDIDNMDDFDLLLKRHKQIQLQLETLEREESEALLENEDIIIDDSFIDIPVDSHLDELASKPGSSGVISNDVSQEKSIPEKFSPFKIKPLRPPIPSIKELSEKQKQDSNKDIAETLENVSINDDTPKTTRSLSTSSQETHGPGTASLKKRMGRKRRRNRRMQRKKAMLARNKDNQPKLNYDSSQIMEPTTEIDSKLMMIASSSANDDMDLKIR